jgi:hypothetical protein
MREVIAAKKAPEAKLLGQCSAEYGCPVHDPLFSALPSGNVFELYRGNALAKTLYGKGVTAITGIDPSTTKLSLGQAIQLETALSKTPHIEKEKLSSWLSSLQYPLHYLDFETMSFAVPLFEGTSPYQQVPFQWSLHVQTADGRVEHRSYLHPDASDPRSLFASTLESALRGAGTIVVYNQSFEEGRMRELAAYLPQHQPWVDAAVGKMVDLLVPFRSFWYYHPSQAGSCSLKSTMPALLGEDHYGKLPIHDGGTASAEYVRVTFTDVPAKERERVRKSLHDYCGLDTEGMVWMVGKLKGI